MDEQTAVGLFLSFLGVIFLLFRNKIAPGAAEFYRKIYTEKNLKIIFLIVGIILIVGGFFIAFLK